MATVDEADRPGTTGSSEADASTTTNTSSMQDSSNHEEALGCEVQSIIPSDTSCASKENGICEGVDEDQKFGEAIKSHQIENNVLHSPFSSPKVPGESKESTPVSDEEVASKDGLSGGHSNAAFLTVDQEPARDVPENDLDIQPLDKNSMSAPGIAINDQEETRVVAGSEIHQLPEPNTTKEGEESPDTAINVPPHKRADFQPPPSRHPGLQNSRHMMPTNEVARSNEIHPVHRQYYPQYDHRRDVVDREYTIRLGAQLMKIKNELDTERHHNLHLRKMIETEQKQKVDAAYSGMLNNLLRDQTEALALKANVEAKERNLDVREKKVQQYEMFLSEGQKQLLYKLGESGDRPMSVVQQEYARRQAEIDVRKSLGDIEAQYAVKIEGLRLRAAAQEMREQQYKSFIRESLRAEMNESALPAEKAGEIAEIEYNNGFADGKEVGRKETFDDAQKRGFLEGYEACHRAQVTLSNFRKGRISHDSPELDFVVDPAHPHSLFSIGVQIGKVEKQAATSTATAIAGPSKTGGKTAVMNSKTTDKSEEERGVNSKEINGASNGPVNGVASGTGNGTGNVNGNRKTNGIFHVAYPAPKLPPSQPSLASKLRSHVPYTHNGYVVLANSPTSSAPSQDHGRTAVQQEEKTVVNLIDLL